MSAWFHRWPMCRDGCFKRNWCRIYRQSSGEGFRHTAKLHMTTRNVLPVAGHLRGNFWASRLDSHQVHTHHLPALRGCTLAKYSAMPSWSETCCC